MDPADITALDTRIKSFVPVHTAPIIACCNCGQPMSSGSTGMAMCSDCIKLSVDITEDVQKSGTITFCKNCYRLLLPPHQWVLAPRESRELMGACLKRLRGLSKLRIVDAQFIWTEPHSRRTKIKVTVQGEAEKFQDTLIQQSFVVEYYEASGQCPDCAKSYTANTWVASIQIRQKVEHKKTFFYLEQLILKHKAHKFTVNIEESREGLNLFYNQRNHAEKMLEFLCSVVPVKYKKSSELISQDTHTSTKTFKFTFSVEIVPICKEDLVVLPKKLAMSLGNINRITLCHRIGNNIYLLDPVSLQTAELAPGVYWRTPFDSLATPKQLIEFMVLDIDSLGRATDKFALAEATVARSTDLGKNDQTYYVKTHLGGILHPGDLVMGYFLTNANYNTDLWNELKPDQIPDVVLVKKSYSDKPRKRTRNWKLKRMAKEYKDVEARATSSREGRAVNPAERTAKEYEEFMRELEDDPELRAEMNLYRADAEEVPDDEIDSEDEEIAIALDELKIDDGKEFSDEEEEEEEDEDEDEGQHSE